MTYKVIIFLACIPSGGALLAKVYGLAEMQTVTLWLFFPAVVLIALVYQKTKKDQPLIAKAILLGAIGGLIGTFGYDLIRVPFMIFGQRVFAPIAAYGVWVLEADASSRFTLVAGWAYHFANGITFGIMYAVWMRGRHWLWAVVWAMLLETIAVVSPFGSIFAIRDAYGALGTAYLGHLAYGIPLGLIVQKGDSIAEWFDEVPNVVKGSAFVVLLLALFSPMLNPSRLAVDQLNAESGGFRVEGARLQPDWIRLHKKDSLRISNSGKNDVNVRNKTLDTQIAVSSGSSETVKFSDGGIYQFFVESDGRSQSSFVIVEPIPE